MIRTTRLIARAARALAERLDPTPASAPTPKPATAALEPDAETDHAQRLADRMELVTALRASLRRYAPREEIARA